MQFNPNELSFSIKRHVPNIDWLLDEVYEIRKPVGLKYKDNNSIIIFGCSYGYGSFLDDNQTFHYKLSESLKRPVFNYASPGQSPQFALMRIRTGKINEIIKHSDYAILVTIGEHVWRVHTNSNGYMYDYLWPKYDKKNDNLVLHKYNMPIIEGSYLYKYIEKLFWARFMARSQYKFIQDYMFDFMKLHYETIQKELKAINPNIKVMILLYGENDDGETAKFSNSSRWKELEKKGFIIVNVHDYLPIIWGPDWQNYIIPNDGHPNEAAWNLIVDLLLNDLKLLK